MNFDAVIYDYKGDVVRSESSLSLRQITEIMAREKGGGNRGKFPCNSPYAQNPFVYSAISQIVEAFSEAPLKLWRQISRPVSARNGSRKRNRKDFVEVVDNPLWDLMDQPNDQQDQGAFMEYVALYLLVCGNAWLFKDEPNSFGLPRSLMVFGDRNVKPHRKDPYSKLEGWEFRARPSDKPIIWPLDEVIHIKMPNPYDPVLGMAPHCALQMSLDADLARMIYDRAFYTNNATPDAVLTYKGGPLNRVHREQVREAWVEMHQGADRMGGLAVLGGDFDFKVWGVQHSQSQFIESRIFTRQEVASIYRMPVQMLNDLEHTGLSTEGLEIARTIMFERAVRPHFRRYESAWNINLVKPFNPRLVAQVDIHTLPVTTTLIKQKALVIKELTASGVPLNDAISLVDLGVDPVEGGDVGFIPNTLMPIEELSTKTLEDEKPTPAVKPAPTKPAPKPAVQPKRSAEAEETLRLLSFPRSRMARKIKRVLFSIRLQALQNVNKAEPFNKEEIQREWVKQLLPIHIAIFEFGKQTADQKVDNTTRTWVDRLQGADERAVDKFFSEIQKGLSEINDPALKEVEEIVGRSTQIVEELFDKLKNRSEEELVQQLSKLNQIAKMIAHHESVWSLNAGRYAGSKVHKLSTEVYNLTECSASHSRFPGDPTVPLTNLMGCGCLVNFVN